MISITIITVVSYVYSYYIHVAIDCEFNFANVQARQIELNNCAGT